MIPFAVLDRCFNCVSRSSIRNHHEVLMDVSAHECIHSGAVPRRWQRCPPGLKSVEQAGRPRRRKTGRRYGVRWRDFEAVCRCRGAYSGGSSQQLSLVQTCLRR
jgi:hypothetical protein